MRALVVLAAGLALPGVLPALAAAGWSAVVVFLAPVIGTVMAAVAAEIELGLGGSLVPDYLAVATTVNIAVIAWWVIARRGARPRNGQAPKTLEAWAWSVLAVAVVAGCLAVPLSALRGALLTGDGTTIWTTHALMLYGGHHELLASLQNPSYVISNPDYPPLASAASALAFKFYGLGNLHLGVDMTVLVTACALGVVAMGIVAVSDVAAAGSGARWPARVVAVAAAGVIGVVGFAVSGPYAVEGYIDLVWAAFAVGAVIWGLVLPRSPQALAVAWICAAAASLTKNEGLTTALIIIVAIALRYRPFSLPGPAARRWAERAVFVLVPALPGLAYAGMMRLLGVHDAFFVTGSPESRITRAGATVLGMAGHPARRPAGAGGAAGRVLVPARGPAAGRPGEPGMAMDLLPGLACDHLRHVRVRRSRDPRLAVAQREPDHDLRSGAAVHGNRCLDGHRRGRPFRPRPRPRRPRTGPSQRAPAGSTRRSPPAPPALTLGHLFLLLSTRRPKVGRFLLLAARMLALTQG